MKTLKTPTNPKKPLRNARREKFAQGMARDLPATQAYMEAGYRARSHSAEANASRLWKDIDVAARVDELRRAESELIMEKSAISKADLIAELRPIAFADMSLDNDGLKWREKLKAIDTIAKLSGMLIERKEVGAPGAFDKMSDDELRAFVVEKAKKFAGKTH
jgi:phage terminase small subunit